MVPTIDVYLWPKDLNLLEKFPSANKMKFPLAKWVQEDFGRFCLKDIDRSVFVSGRVLHNEVMGDVTVHHISGAVATLLIGYHRPDLRMPFTNCGDNCGESIYQGSKDVRMKWYWEGYCPELNPMQFVHFPELGTTVLGQDVQMYLIDGIPYELTSRCRVIAGRRKRGEI